MAFTIPENLHPDLMPLAWLIGTWRGKGKAEYPDMKSINYAQEVTSLVLGKLMMIMKLLNRMTLRLAFGACAIKRFLK
jgi:hypothetical protein